MIILILIASGICLTMDAARLFELTLMDVGIVLDLQNDLQELLLRL